MKYLPVARAALASVCVLSFAAASAPAETIQAESVTPPSGYGTTVGDSTAAGGKASLLWSATSVTYRLTAPADTLTIRVRGEDCLGSPSMLVTIDGVDRFVYSARTTGWSDFTRSLSPALTAGTHTIKLTYLADKQNASCDRNLFVDEIETSLRSQQLYRSPISHAQQAEDLAWSQGRTSDAAALDKIASQPSGIWFDGSPSDTALMDRFLNSAAPSNARPVFVLYAIPNRDSGQFAAGGLTTAAAYRAWIDSIAAVVRNRPVLFVVEPDAVAMPISEPGQSERWSLLKYAISRLGALPDARVYLDAANSAWWKPRELAPRLLAAGVANADGFAVNTSNYNWTQDEIDYGRAVSDLVGGKPFVVDTSRNGRGPYVAPWNALAPATSYWCNPAGRGVGLRPSLSTGHERVDAWLWIKPPGETDGPCNGGPENGFYLTRALELSRNSAW